MTVAPADTRGIVEPCFQVEVSGRQLGQFAECTGIGAEYEVLEHREGGNNDFVHLLRGHRRHTNLVLKRGITDQDALLSWFHDIERTPPPPLSVTLMDSTGTPYRSFTFAGAFPIKWTGPNGASQTPAAAMESLEVGHQGLVP
ncbi:MAG: phage tail protein [Solirubrobacteraceae bacterium]